MKTDIHIPGRPCPPWLKKTSTLTRETHPEVGGLPQSHFFVKPSLLT
jgi:hypothetical protein